MSRLYLWETSSRTPPHTPEYHGISEEVNRTILQATRAVLHSHGNNLPSQLWGEIAAAIVHIRNRAPVAYLNGRSPYEAWFGCKPDLTYLRQLGTTAYMHVPKERRKD